MALGRDIITTKCVELSKSLLNTGVGLYDYDLYVSRSIGNLARLAVSIKKSGEITRDKYAGIATALKIDYSVAENQILKQLEELNWVDITREGKKIKRIDEKIPPTEDILSDLGKEWENLGPSPIDVSTIDGLNRLSKQPYTKEAFLSELNISEEVYNITFNYGEQARYFGSFQSQLIGKDILWTPLYWAGKLDRVQKYINKQSDDNFFEIGDLTRKFIKYPGIPYENISTTNNKVLIDTGISFGYFPSVGVKNRVGREFEYVFAATPQFELDPKKDLFEKARMIVACLRHGQYHADYSRIKWPHLILSNMRANTLSSHSYADVQYFLLKCHGIVDLEKFGNRFKVKWIDTPENNLAADIADELLRGEEPLPRTSEDIDIRNLLIDGIYNYSSEQRRFKAVKRIAAPNEYSRMMETLIGVKE
jgi:hypothetical protein